MTQEEYNELVTQAIEGHNFICYLIGLNKLLLKRIKEAEIIK